MGPEELTLSLWARSCRVIGIEKWLVIGFGCGTVLEASLGSFCPTIPV